jgi:hypothetical protein
MAVVGLDIHSRKPLADGASFGSVGTYERIDGIVRFAVDPAHPANQAIVDLDKGERGPDGLVYFSADFCILQPTDPAKGNGRLLFEVLNRGRKNIQRHLNRAAATGDAPVEIDPGDGFMMERGWTMAWCGWQWDVIRSAALMGLEAPQAVEGGQPIDGMMSLEFQPNGPDKDKLLANRVHRTYPAADLNDPNAQLTVRDWPGGERTTIARSRWQFARDEGGKPAPDANYLWLEGGFEAGKMYEIVFRTSNCPVVGTGLLAVRDFPAFLHHGTAAEGNPCAGRIEKAYGYGVSQSGRFLRHFLYLGLNLDEQGRQVYDGLMPQVAGARRGQFNHRFAQPSDQSQPSIGHLMPFADDPQTDPLTGETGGLLDRQRALGGVPKVYVINTAAEYYRGDCSLLHTDISGEHDVTPPAEVRAYLFASSQHGPGTLPLTTIGAAEGAIGTHGFNAVDYTPLTRAALTNLDRWVSDGIEPPPNAIPRIADGTAAPASEVLPQFDAIPDITIPDPDRLLMVWRTSLGPDAGKGIVSPPPKLSARYRNLVSQVDGDGNEVGGIRLPQVAVPVATYTGWNPRASVTGGAGQIMPMQGSTLPFPATRQEREQRADPRLSIEERYRDRDDYRAKALAVAQKLAEQRYILESDIDLAVEIALERYDAFAAAPVGSER